MRRNCGRRARPLKLDVRHGIPGPVDAVYVLDRPKHRWALWGDYGNILLHGMTRHLPRCDGELQLERTGPFIPAISFPGIADIVLTDRIRIGLSERLPVLTFKPIRKTRIVRLNWETWPDELAAPPILPESGEPEDYILGAANDLAVAAALGDLWELVPIVNPKIQANGGKFALSEYRGEHLIRASASAGYNFISADLASHLRALAPQDINLREAISDFDA